MIVILNKKLFIIRVVYLTHSNNGLKSYLFTLVNNFLPFLRRFLIVLRPWGVAIRALKPDTFKIECRLLFESVRFAIS